CLDEAGEHRGIERVHLVGADQAHVGDAVLELDRDPVLHVSFSDFSHCRRRRFTSSRGTGPCDLGHISTAMARCTSAKVQSSGSRSSSARTSAFTSTFFGLLIGSPSATRLVPHTPPRSPGSPGASNNRTAGPTAGPAHCATGWCPARRSRRH